jgi:hypothetical protein
MTTIGPRSVASALDASDVARVAHEREVEEVRDLLHERLAPVEGLRVRGEHARRVDGERRVDDDRDLRDLALAGEGVQVVHELLRAAHGEGGDEHAAAARGGLAHDAGERGAGVVVRRVVAVAVGGLHDHGVRARRGLRVADDGQAAAADVAGEDEAARLAVLGDVEGDARGAEDVAGLVEGGTDARGDVDGLLVRDADHQVEGAHGVAHGVERLGVLAAAAGEEVGVLLLDVRRVGEHQGAEVPRRGRRPDGASVALGHQEREPPRVVDVGVGEDHGVDLGDRQREA